MKALKFLFIGLVLFIIIAIATSDDDETETLTQVQKDSVENVSDSLLIVKSKEDSLKTIEAEKTYKQLKSKFIIKEDEFKDITFYTHKTFGKYWPHRKTLTAGANSTGYAYLRSNYFSNDWLFHTYVSIKAGEAKFSTVPVPSFDNNNIRDNNTDGIYEVVTYENSEPQLEMIYRLNKEKILVRFQGDQFHDDVVLSISDKRALKETWELAQALKIINNQ